MYHSFHHPADGPLPQEGGIKNAYQNKNFLFLKSFVGGSLLRELAAGGRLREYLQRFC